MAMALGPYAHDPRIAPAADGYGYTVDRGGVLYRLAAGECGWRLYQGNTFDRVVASGPHVVLLLREFLGDPQTAQAAR